jgi:TM2 domain-containing membrane protein YozV
VERVGIKWGKVDMKNRKVLLAGTMILVGPASAYAGLWGVDWSPDRVGSLILVLIVIVVGIAIQKMNKNKKEMLKEMAEEEANHKTLPMLICCPICNKEISRAATACPSCGHPINPQSMKTSQRSWSPGIAALLSFIIPGAGQMYKGHVGTGILWFIFVIGGYFLFIIPGAILHLVCIFNAARGQK